MYIASSDYEIFKNICETEDIPFINNNDKNDTDNESIDSEITENDE